MDFKFPSQIHLLAKKLIMVCQTRQNHSHSFPVTRHVLAIFIPIQIRLILKLVQPEIRFKFECHHSIL